MPVFTSNLNKKFGIKVILVLENTQLSNLLKNQGIKYPAKVLEDFQGREEQILSFYDSQSLIILVGLGLKEKIEIENLSKIFDTLQKFINNLKLDNSKLLYIPTLYKLEDQIFQIFKINYQFEKYKTEKKTQKKKKGNKKTKKKLDINYQIYVPPTHLKNTPKTVNMISSITLVKDLGNEPANILNPDEYVKRIKQRGQKSKFKVKVLGNQKLEKLGLHTLLSVSKGSQWGGYLVELTLPGKNKKGPRICLVGKGITFDSGGISIKSSYKMGEMKTDMLGSATVLGIIDYLAQTKSNKNVVGYLAIAENMPDALATRPGDVVTSYSGKTVEILNTDAEGRLVLADALTYSQRKQKPDIIIDMATLTGQQESVSCSLFTSIMSNDEKLEKQIIKSGELVNEKLVSFPLYPEFAKNTHSNIADIKNDEFGCGASMIHAGAFLSNFIEDGVRWCHLDIAGPARNKKKTTGIGVRMLTQLIEDL